jgi:hypothetical protein
MFGWNTRKWCHRCLAQWERFETTAASPKRRFEELADFDLTRAILDAIERGDIVPPPGYALPEEIPPLITRVGPSLN